MRLLLLIWLILLLFGCQSLPQEKSMPGIYNCQILSNVNIEKLNDSYSGNRKLWKELNDLFQKNESRKLVVFFDGTGNNKKRPTNIWELYKLTVKNACDGNAVIPYYDKGVGAKWFDRIRGGAVGRGISLNIRQAYRFLVHTYLPGDEIYIFGFSRGAYTARSFSGMLALAGLLDRKYVEKSPTGEIDLNDLRDKVAKIYREYHVKPTKGQSIKVTIGNNISNLEKIIGIKLLDVSVRGIGVFDTVAALGFRRVSDPLKHHTDFYAEIGFHALAIDETRKDFELLRFTQKDRNDNPETLKEMWFAGVHSNIGGGYDLSPGCNTANPNDKYYLDGLEATSLNWMINNFKDEGIFYAGKPFEECRLGKMHDEYFDRWFPPYRLMGKYIRKKSDTDLVHHSVNERMKGKLFHPHSKRESKGVYMPVGMKLQIDDSYKIE